MSASIARGGRIWARLEITWTPLNSQGSSQVDLDMILGNDWNLMDIALPAELTSEAVQMAAMVIHKEMVLLAIARRSAIR